MEVHFDGACERTRNGSIATYGFTIEGAGFAYEGHGLAVPPFHARATNNVAEYSGAICALEWLARNGYTGDVVVRGDSLLVVRQMTGEYRVRKEHLQAYHDWLKQLTLRFPKVEFHWVPRAQNQRADLLSKQALKEAAYSPPKGRRATVVVASDDESDENEP
ncbi:MAG: ribonuclease HI [Thermoplasmata archaeon]|nr:ribonuclease HI [Thermoplasmata archaeon]